MVGKGAALASNAEVAIELDAVVVAVRPAFSAASCVESSHRSGIALPRSCSGLGARVWRGTTASAHVLLGFSRRTRISVSFVEWEVCHVGYDEYLLLCGSLTHGAGSTVLFPPRGSRTVS